MGERRLIPLELGAGLARAHGSFAVRPGKARDLRNVFARVDKVIARAGLTLTATLLDEDEEPCSHVLALHPQRSLRIGIAVGYQQNGTNGGKVYVYVTDSEGGNPTLVEHEDEQMFWFQLTEGAEPPSIFTADTFGLVFLAHDEESIAFRATTVYYDPTEDPPLRNLQADLDGDGDADVKFRGVERHLDYLVGWGYGSASEDRPELVRVSNPGDPLTWNPEHYFIAGQRGDPVMNCKPAANGLIVFKEHEHHLIFGYDRATFGIKPLDHLAGLRAPRLAVTVHGDVLFWSHGGPRVTDGGGPSRDLGFDLDLRGFEPADLVEPGRNANAFATYIPSRIAVGFFFNRRVYTLCLDGQQNEWTYQELGQDAYCAGLMYITTAQKPTGYPEWLEPAQINDFSIIARIAHHGALGPEFIEVWLKPEGGEWSRKTTVPANAGAPTQTIPIDDLEADTTYDAAVRYVIGGQYADGYEGSTPDDWTATTADDSKGQFTTSLTAFALASPVWSRVDAVTEKVALSWSGGPSADAIVQKSTDGSTWEDVETVEQPTQTYDYICEAGEGETLLYFRIKVDGTAAVSTVRSRWIGPDMPLGCVGSGTTSGCDAQGATTGQPPAGWQEYIFDDPWDPGQANEEFQILWLAWANDSDFPAATIEALLWNQAGSPTEASSIPIAVTPAGTTARNFTIERNQGVWSAKIRHALTQFGVTDYSDWTATRAIPATAP